MQERQRLSQLPDGRLLNRLKRRWRNGATEIIFDVRTSLQSLPLLCLRLGYI